MVRRVERLLDRFLAEEAEREQRRLRALAARGRGSASTRRASGRRWRSTAGACTGRSTGSTGPPTGAPSSSTTSSPARSRRGRSSRSRRSCSCQLYLIAVAEHWGAEAVGGLYHPLRGTSSRRPRGVVLDDAAAELVRLPTSTTNDVVDARGASRSCWPTRGGGPGEIVARMRSGEIRRDPGPREGLRGHDVCPAFCELRADLPPRPRPRCEPRTTTRSERVSGGAARRPPSRRRRSQPAAADVLRRGRRRDRQDRRDGRPLLPPGLRRGRLPRRDPRLHLHRQGGGRAAPADPGRAGAAGRGRLRARRASCSAGSAAPG